MTSDEVNVTAPVRVLNVATPLVEFDGVNPNAVVTSDEVNVTAPVRVLKLDTPVLPLLADVILPLASTVIFAFVYEPGVTEVVDNVVAKLPVPEPVISPVNVISWSPVFVPVDVPVKLLPDMLPVAAMWPPAVILPVTVKFAPIPAVPATLKLPELSVIANVAQFASPPLVALEIRTCRLPVVDDTFSNHNCPCIANASVGLLDNGLAKFSVNCKKFCAIDVP